MAKAAPAASSNIYTVLVFAAFVALLSGIIYVWFVRLPELGISPFEYPDAAAINTIVDTARAVGLA